MPLYNFFILHSSCTKKYVQIKFEFNFWYIEKLLFLFEILQDTIKQRIKDFFW